MISTDGLGLLGIDPIEHVVHQSDSGLLVDETRETAITGRLGGSVETGKADAAAPSLPKAGGKLHTLITALRKPEGSTIAERLPMGPRDRRCAASVDDGPVGGGARCCFPWVRETSHCRERRVGALRKDSRVRN